MVKNKAAKRSNKLERFSRIIISKILTLLNAEQCRLEFLQYRSAKSLVRNERESRQQRLGWTRVRSTLCRAHSCRLIGARLTFVSLISPVMTRSIPPFRVCRLCRLTPTTGFASSYMLLMFYPRKKSLQGKA